MDQPNPNNNFDSSGDIPLKRKRGRPRKYPKPYAEENAHILNIQNVNQNPVGGGNASVPPGFDRVNGSQPHRRDIGNDLNDPMVGQVVSCVIEAVFDAGYLLSAKVGNSNTTLRGLVLKPGHYAPLSAENDVAPGVPMIQRNEVPFSGGANVKKPHRRERNKHYVNIHRNAGHTMKGSPSFSQSSRGAVSSSGLVASQGKNQQSMERQTNSLLSRGNVVPVKLQPVNLQNGVMVSNQPSQAMTQASLGSTPIVAKDILADGNQMQISQALTSQNLLPRGTQNENGSPNLSSAEVQRVEANSMRQPGMPFENLVTEVVRRVEAPSESIDTDTNNSKSVENISIKDSGSGQEEKVSDVGQPLLIKPLQAVQTVSQEHSASASGSSGNSEAGKMIDQPQVLQGNRIEKQPLQAEELASGNKLDGNFKAEPDEKTGQAA
ncbi:uncharacterized protein LOC114745910 isoform X1 [Neltuma alba]|uniref:uncharacterized protein LOC114745910 isoform X1 n=1 Tax=Neltuma alba TaxID=207710 RepID=UPI0010A57D37|nr:uncharacterized protein LOC114745910 isoform X1 [Prosopis alba]XP_028789912.1 uncharacterized protein LOC114745910 isoform X1 [Prosopis alba]